MTAATRGQPDRGDKTAGRRGASGACPMGTKGEKERGQTARQPRNTRQEGGAEGREEGREERGRRHGWPRAWGVEKGNEEEHGSRQGAERDQTDRGKKEIYKYLRERREKNAAETRKGM